MKKHELLQKAMRDYPNGTKLNHKLSGTFNCELPYFIDGTNSVSDRNGRCLFGSSEIDFGGWAEIVTDRKPLLTSEDEVELFDDSYIAVVRKNKNIYYISAEYDTIKNIDNGYNVNPKSISNSASRWLFSTKQAALDFIDKMNKPEKKYLKIERDLNNSGIKIGSEVIVTDGSYMIDAQTKEHVSGIYFNKDGLHEVLKVTKVNHPFETDYSVLSEILSVHNNCEITGFDKRKYYCSRINIKAI